MNKLIVLVGPPGSGKSTLAKQYESEGYVRVNQDEQKAEHMDVFYEAISQGKNIVVDRMNFNKDQRSRYLVPAKEAGYETTIKVIHESREICDSRMGRRKDHPTIKDSFNAYCALNLFFSKYERPTEDEADNIEFIYPNYDKPLAVICDLDGTLCNIDHRLHYVRDNENKKKNWKAFFDNMSKDTPNAWCQEIIEKLSGYFPIVFASGRPDDYKLRTIHWLEDNALPTRNLYMRCTGDYRQDYIAKEIILDFEILTRFTPYFFIDDRKQVVDLWRRRGYVCLQCNEGAF